jgi:hypothetical protein
MVFISLMRSLRGDAFFLPAALRFALRAGVACRDL